MKKLILNLFILALTLTFSACSSGDAITQYDVYCDAINACDGYQAWGYTSHDNCVSTLKARYKNYELCSEQIMNIYLCRSKLNCIDIKDTPHYFCKSDFTVLDSCAELQYYTSADYIYDGIDDSECSETDEPTCFEGRVKSCKNGSYQYMNCPETATCKFGKCILENISGNINSNVSAYCDKYDTCYGFKPINDYSTREECIKNRQNIYNNHQSCTNEIDQVMNCYNARTCAEWADDVKNICYNQIKTQNSCFDNHLDDDQNKVLQDSIVNPINCTANDAFCDGKTSWSCTSGQYTGTPCAISCVDGKCTNN